MSEEAKQRLTFAILTAEVDSDLEDDQRGQMKYIKDKLHSFYGGYWSLWTANNDEYEAYFKSDNLAVFDYGGKRWNVYEHACNKHIESYALPNVKFILRKLESKELKEQVLLAIFTAENDGITGHELLKHVATHMESVYGGDWSVHVVVSHGRVNHDYDLLYKYHAFFRYEEKTWYLYKNAC